MNMIDALKKRISQTFGALTYANQFKYLDTTGIFEEKINEFNLIFEKKLIRNQNFSNKSTRSIYVNDINNNNIFKVERIGDDINLDYVYIEVTVPGIERRNVSEQNMKEVRYDVRDEGEIYKLFKSVDFENLLEKVEKKSVSIIKEQSNKEAFQDSKYGVENVLNKVSSIRQPTEVKGCKFKS